MGCSGEGHQAEEGVATEFGCCIRSNKRYDVSAYQGQNLFLCGGGRLVGPDYMKAVGTYLLILVPSMVTICIVYVPRSEMWSS